MKKVFAIMALLALSLAAGAQEKRQERRVVVQPGPGGAHVRDVMIMRHGPFMGRWWKNSEVVQKVGVSDNQIQQMEQIFQQHRLKLIDVRAELERQEARLEPLVEADNPDENQIVAQIDKIAATRAELEKANALMSLAIRRVLTTDQWKKLQEVQPRPGMPPMHFELPAPPPPGAPAPPPEPEQ